LESFPQRPPLPIFAQVHLCRSGVLFFLFLTCRHRTFQYRSIGQALADHVPGSIEVLSFPIKLRYPFPNLPMMATESSVLQEAEPTLGFIRRSESNFPSFLQSPPHAWQQQKAPSARNALAFFPSLVVAYPSCPWYSLTHFLTRPRFLSTELFACFALRFFFPFLLFSLPQLHALVCNLVFSSRSPPTRLYDLLLPTQCENRLILTVFFFSVDRRLHT